MKTIRLLLVGLSALLGACTSSGPVRPAKIVTLKSAQALDLADVNGRIRIRVNDGDTLVDIDDRRFICRGADGYIGRLDTHAGWLKVGKLEFGYDLDKVWVRGPKSWSTFPREGEQNYVVSQDGSLGRSVYKN